MEVVGRVARLSDERMVIFREWATWEDVMKNIIEREGGPGIRTQVPEITNPRACQLIQLRALVIL